LVAGGSDGSQALSSVEIFDPVTQSWSAAGSMTSSYPAKAFLLTDGRVFLLHPADANGARPGELLDPLRGTFQPLPTTTASTPVGGTAAAVLLSSGKVLIVRAAGPAVYDPATNTYSAAKTDCGAILGVWLRLLPDSRVLCRDVSPGAPGSLAAIPLAFIYDPRTDSAARANPAAPYEDVLLSNGLVRIGCGRNGFPPTVGPNILYDT